MAVLPLVCEQWRHRCCWQKPGQLRQGRKDWSVSASAGVSPMWAGPAHRGTLHQGLECRPQNTSPSPKSLLSTFKAGTPDEEGPAKSFLQQRHLYSLLPLLPPRCKVASGPCVQPSPVGTGGCNPQTSILFPLVWNASSPSTFFQIPKILLFILQNPLLRIPLARHLSHSFLTGLHSSCISYKPTLSQGILMLYSVTVMVLYSVTVYIGALQCLSIS